MRFERLQIRLMRALRKYGVNARKNSNEIEELREKNRIRFLNAAAPVLEEIMRETNAAVILEQRSVFVSSNAIDITQTAIERIDAQLGDGTTEPE